MVSENNSFTTSTNFTSVMLCRYCHVVCVTNYNYVFLYVLLLYTMGVKKQNKMYLEIIIISTKDRCGEVTS